MGVLFAVLATALLTAIGLGIAMIGVEESLLASHARTARALRHASMAAAHLAVADLRAAASWNAVLTPGAVSQLSGAPSRFADTTLTPVPPWGGSTLDLRAVTNQWQAVADASRGPADAAQNWRLILYGPFARAAAAAGPWYVAVWAADDRADTDGDPGVDSNGILALHAVALGPADAAMGVDLTVRRTASGAVVVTTIRPAW